MIDKIEYIGGDPDNGIKYDLKLIRKEYKKLGVPKMFWNPSKGPLEQSRTFCVLSERSIGKTTNALSNPFSAIAFEIIALDGLPKK